MTDIIKGIMDVAKANGYKGYEVEGHEGFAFLVTPKRNVLVINKSQWGTGVNFSFEYKPNKKSGSGCSCHLTTDEWDFGCTKVTAKQLAKYETIGYKFALRLKAPLYKNEEEWLADCYWNGRGLREV